MTVPAPDEAFPVSDEFCCETGAVVTSQHRTTFWSGLTSVPPSARSKSTILAAPHHHDHLPTAPPHLRRSRRGHAKYRGVEGNNSWREINQRRFRRHWQTMGRLNLSLMTSAAEEGNQDGAAQGVQRRRSRGGGGEGGYSWLTTGLFWMALLYQNLSLSD